MTQTFYITALEDEVLTPDFFRLLLKVNDDADAHYGLALSLLRKTDESVDREMFDHFKIASDKGHVEAMNKLGICYFHGLGVEKDVSKGIECFIKAAEMESISGCFNAGNELLYGKSIKPDYEAAFRYLSKAANAGDDRAMNSLGIMYLLGKHVNQNTRKAKRLFKKAAKLGNRSAIANLERMQGIWSLPPDIEHHILKPDESPPEESE